MIHKMANQAFISHHPLVTYHAPELPISGLVASKYEVLMQTDLPSIVRLEPVPRCDPRFYNLQIATLADVDISHDATVGASHSYPVDSAVAEI